MKIEPEDRHRLAQLVGCAFPESVAAIIVGSALHRPVELVSDVDTMAVVCDGIGQKRPIGFCRRYPVECTIYDPAFTKVLTFDEKKRFLLLREVRRILTGVPLYGEAIIGEWKKSLLGLEIPTAPVRAVLEVALGRLSCEADKTLSVVSAVEGVLFSSGCLFTPDGPNKPKWYFLDCMRWYPEIVQRSVIDLLSDPGFSHLKPNIGQLRQLQGPSLTPVIQTLIADTLTLNDARLFEAARLTHLVLLSRLFAEGSSPEQPAVQTSKLLAEWRAILDQAALVINYHSLSKSIRVAGEELLSYLETRDFFSAAGAGVLTR